MILFLSMIIASLAVYFINGLIPANMDESVRAMLNLIVFIVAYMISKKYLKTFRD